MRTRARATGKASLFVVACAALALVGTIALVSGCGGGSASTIEPAAQDAPGGACAVPPAAGVATSAGASGAEIGGPTEIATFAAGCFWGVEAQFSKITGVVDVVSGYTGGTTTNATYDEVKTGRTGHAEAVRVEYDPDVVSYETLVDTFFQIHDPTTLNRQGWDRGTQYRSAIFFHTPQQQTVAEAFKLRLERNGAYDDPIVTGIEAAGPFWRAEDYHQDYYTG